jgi:hypothetical protein
LRDAVKYRGLHRINVSTFDRFETESEPEPQLRKEKETTLSFLFDPDNDGGLKNSSPF